MADNSTLRDMVEDLQHDLNELQANVWRLVAERDKLQRQNEALRDIVRAAQLLVDLKHVTGNLTDETLANLTAALRSWYEPNGGGR